MKSNVLIWIGAVLFMTGLILVLQAMCLIKQRDIELLSSKLEYKVLSSAKMDLIGFQSVAMEEGVQADEKGQYTFPKSSIDKIAKDAMLVRTLQAVEADGGWRFVEVTADNYFIFKRLKRL